MGTYAFLAGRSAKAGASLQPHDCLKGFSSYNFSTVSWGFVSFVFLMLQLTTPFMEFPLAAGVGLPWPSLQTPVQAFARPSAPFSPSLAPGCRAAALLVVLGAPE